MLKKFGLPRLIILIFLISTYVIAPFVGIPITTALSDIRYNYKIWNERNFSFITYAYDRIWCRS